MKFARKASIRSSSANKENQDNLSLMTTSLSSKAVIDPYSVNPITGKSGSCYLKKHGQKSVDPMEIPHLDTHMKF